MIRSTGTRVLIFTLLLSGMARADERGVPDPHVRPTCAQMRHAVDVGSNVSATFRALVDRLEGSDVVVYVVARSSSSHAIAAHTAFISAAGGRRYVLVAIDPKYVGSQLIGLIGHELRHAVEIADEPSVVDTRSLVRLYRRIGFGGAVGGGNQFDTNEAIEAGGRVLHDVRTATAFIRAGEWRPRPR